MTISLCICRPIELCPNALSELAVRELGITAILTRKPALGDGTVGLSSGWTGCACSARQEVLC